ncbi:MAG: hypothetical protein LBS94_04300 [Prevotellaceae bacterium]|jgi:nitrite reductase/ring-hydroxylating ferredoxin subunit|nr:hypothetical protein [Prevotellaceae bacterium]
MKFPIPTLLLLTLLAGCGTNEWECPVPVPERFSFTIMMPTSEVMTTKVMPNFGYGRHGVIVFRYNNANNEVFAYDCTCPASEDCVNNGIVEHDKAGHAVCRRCKATYSLTDGRHLQQKIMLRPYYVEPFNNSPEFFRVSN